MEKIFKKSDWKKGFSLIGIVFSVFIISVGLVTILNLFSSVLYGELKDEKRLIAVYLAEEGIEAVRGLRDNGWFNPSNDWDLYLGDTSGVDQVVVFENADDISQGWGIIEITSQNSKVYSNEIYYAQSESSLGGDWKDTGFERWININEVYYDGWNGADDQYMRVNVKVSYKGEILAEITSYLNNWR